MYKECGYHYNADQEAFMEKYAYLEIHYNHPIWKEDMLLRLNPIEAQKDITMIKMLVSGEGGELHILDL